MTTPTTPEASAPANATAPVTSTVLAYIEDRLNTQAPTHDYGAGYCAALRDVQEKLQAALAQHQPLEAHEKAVLWDGLMGAGRLRVMGWAGPDDAPTHIGLELWVRYPGYDFTESNAQAQALIAGFARAAAHPR
ncbi:hypothetical protein [Deinococcus multiflagellatus]|uniref:Uncharacterized protein n=1 Tax=Deinococcus multiflagellatus TaxID=1656887 RepID=A0ABW1ZQP3_9DEIO|nr:hypothetical protein [Deinococcus multiflagellatus]MBZ9715320.1 hypothetical protein [Deinococcus multiflagellatus]